MKRQMYEGKILEHYQEPRNEGRVEEPDMEADVSNPNCGDELEFTATVENGELEKLGFEGEGCALSIAAASLLTQTMAGEEIEQISEIEERELFSMMGIQKDEITPTRMKCVLLPKEGLERMVDDDE